MKHPHRHNLNLISWMLAVIGVILLCYSHIWAGVFVLLFAFIGNGILFNSELKQPARTQPAKGTATGPQPSPSYGQIIKVNGIGFRVDVRMCMTGKPDHIAFVDCSCMLPGEQRNLVRFTVPDYRPAREQDRLLLNSIMDRNPDVVKNDRQAATDSLKHREQPTPEINPDTHAVEPDDPRN